MLSDFHIHTTFSDGKNSPEEMVLEAIRLGVEKIGFSDHSYTEFDRSCCMAKKDKQLYIDTINDLKKKYSDKISVYCGVEQDLYSCVDTVGYDYVIGSVHYLKMGDEYISVDESVDSFKNSVRKYFSGDPISFAEKYFTTVAEVADKTNADIIGHFDLITKFNREGLFDESDMRYVSAWKNAADRLLKCNKPFEINTGAISRGYKDFPYPSREIINYIKENGGRFILSSDAHCTGGICFEFDKWKKLSG